MVGNSGWKGRWILFWVISEILNASSIVEASGVSVFISKELRRIINNQYDSRPLLIMDFDRDYIS